MEENVSTVRQGLESDLDVLRKVGALDAEIGKLKGYEAEIPLILSREEEKCHEAERGVRALEERIESFKKELRGKEGEVSGYKDQIAKRRSQLIDVKTNKEYSALLSEIAGMEEKIAGSEERQLVLMEDLEGAGSDLKIKKRRLEEEKQRFEAVKKQKELEKVRLREALEEERAKKAEARSRLDPKLAQLYDRLVFAGKRNAVTAYKAQACQACFARVTPQEEVLLRRGKDVIICPRCSRVLYWGGE